ncbi:hypothetical protein AVEN_27251-1 [Araneus ventricosus]|uniref:Uncharacterized protein n=1 Tax=Araneus ventricosus TaxID=182803 RepID=A0A4Y2C9X5_ARAVE|nr:hypothetical protein AVEN_27251-1 [Araneus ventricosus]
MGYYSLVILTSSFEKTRWLFLDGACNLEPRSDDEDGTWEGTRISKIPHHTSDKNDLAFSRPHTRRIYSGIGFRTWNHPPPEAESLPLGHRGP